ALLAHRAEHRDQLDDDQRRGEAAERVGPVVAAADEQERQPCGEPQQETEEVRLPAPGERREVPAGSLGRSGRGHAAEPSEASGRISSSAAMARAGAPSSSLCTAKTIGMSMPRRRASSTSTGAVCAPSATVRRSLISACGFSPRPRALPSEKLRLEVDEQVSTRSPRPQRPASVSLLAPSAAPKRCISA